VAKSSAKKPSRIKSAPVKKVAKKPVVSPARRNGSKVSKAKQTVAAKKAQPGAKPSRSSARIVKPTRPAKPVLKSKVVAKSESAKSVATQSKGKKGKIPVSVRTPAKTARPPVVAAKPTTSLKSLSPKSTRASSATATPKPEVFQHQPAVATNFKPRKSQIGMGVKELEHYADLLRAKRRELVGDMSSMEREALRSGSYSNLSTLPVHMADMGTDNFEQEFTLGLVEKDRNLLREINNALAKIQNGTYGICEGTGLPIGKPRLEAAPWARYSIEYARQREKNGMGVRTL
jgi:RNA polymerase-binding protein DksA